MAGDAAPGGDHGPVALGIPLLHPAAIALVGDIEVAYRIHGEGWNTRDLAES